MALLQNPLLSQMDEKRQRNMMLKNLAVQLWKSALGSKKNFLL
jgi:hypothetical protein